MNNKLIKIKIFLEYKLKVKKHHHFNTQVVITKDHHNLYKTMKTL